jgi:hypothetical protein
MSERGPQDNHQTVSEEQKERQKALVLNCVRAGGALFMLAGTACGLDLGGIAGALGLTDGLTQKMVGGTLFAVGVVDFLVLPQVLAKKLP